MAALLPVGVDGVLGVQEVPEVDGPPGADLLAGGDRGTPVVDSAPEHASAKALTKLAADLLAQKPSLLGRRLNLTPNQ